MKHALFSLVAAVLTAALALGLIQSPNTRVFDFQWVVPIDINDANLSTGQDTDIATVVGTTYSGSVVVGGHARTGRSGCLTHVRKAFLAKFAAADGNEIFRIDSDDPAFFPGSVGDGAVLGYAFYVELTALTIHGDYAYATGFAHLAWQGDAGTDGSTILWIIKFDISEIETVECQVIGRQPPNEAEPVGCPSISVALESSQARGYGITVSNSEFVVVTGWFQTPYSADLDFETGQSAQESDNAGVDMFLLSLTLDLAPLSVLTPGVPSGETPGYDEALAVAADSTGAIYATGNFGSSQIDFGNNVSVVNNQGQDLFVVKCTLSGTGVFTAIDAIGVLFAFNGGEDSGTGIATYGDTIAITGYFTGITVVDGTWPFTMQSSGGEDAFVLAYEWNNGFVPAWGHWAGNVSSATDEWATAVTITDDGVVVTTLFYSGTLGTSDDVTEVSVGGVDIFVWAHDVGTGNLQWYLTAGGDSDDRPWGVAGDPSSKVTVVGEVTKPSNGDVEFGSKSISGSTITDTDGFVTIIWDM